MLQPQGSVKSLAHCRDVVLMTLRKRGGGCKKKAGTVSKKSFTKPIKESAFDIPAAEASIDCFKCVSLNNSNPACEDPFHNNYTSDLLERPCMGGRKGRNGLFPASSCIKLTGTYCKCQELYY